MPVLTSLSFTALPKADNDPVQARRAKFVSKLEEQKQLLKDPNHIRTSSDGPRWTARGRPSTKQQAVRAGELDDLFSQATKTGLIGEARKAP
jgi:hypothetical protein